MSPFRFRPAARRLALAAALLAAAGCGRGKTTQDWVAQMKDSDSAQRLRAVKAVAGSRSEAALVVPALAEALRDPNAFVRRDAAEALKKIGPEARPAVPAIVATLRDRNRTVRKAAVEALKSVDPETAARARLR
jgi:HEAT repeat protein